LKNREKAGFFYQFAALLNAGISVERSLSLAAQGCNPSFQRYLTKVGAAVKAGSDLATAMALDSRYLDSWSISLIRLAEYSGSLSETCRRLATASEVQQRREKLYGSLRLGACAIIWSLLVLLAAILNPHPHALMKPSFWLYAIGLGLLVVGLSFLVSRYPGRGLQQLVARVPAFGKLMQAASLLYLAELELPLSCGVSMLAALELLRDRRLDPIMAENLTLAAKGIRAGNTLSHSLQGKLPPLALQMIRTGEETGNLDAAFHQLSQYYEGELERTLRQLEGIFRPFTILAMGGLVALLAIRLLTELINALPG
jgi:type II secretory pathway component PulF